MIYIDCEPLTKFNTSALSQFSTNWNNFGKILTGKTCLKTHLKTPTDIDDAVNVLAFNIQSSVWDSAKPMPTYSGPYTTKTKNQNP